MHELNLLLQNILCIKKVWFNSSVQKIQEVQHADSAAAEKSSQSSHYINLCVEDLTESETAVKWTCESSAWQNENSNQYFYSHHSFHLKCHFHQCMSNLQCNHQISTSSWSSHLTFVVIRKTKRQKNHIQEFCNQNDKHSEQLLANNIWCLLCNFNFSVENKNIHFLTQSVS